MAKKNKKQKKSRNKESAAIKWPLYFFAIMLFAFILYGNTLKHEYALDDFSAIKENYVTKQGVSGIGTIWKEHYRFGYWNSKASLYRPFTLMTFALDWELSPDNPGFSHFVNVLLYGFCGMILFLCLIKLFKKYNILIPIAITALFMAHPVHVEAVANIKSRDEVLAFLFCFLSLWQFLKHLENDKILNLVFSICWYGLALFSKESAITFIAVYPLCLYFFSKKELPKYLLKFLTFLIPAGIYLILRKSIVGGVGLGGDPSPLDNAIFASPNPATQLATAISTLGIYFKTLVLPYDLNHDLGYKEIVPVGFGNWKALLNLLICLGLAVYAFWGLKKKNLISFGILFFAITFSILSNVFIKIGTVYGERLLFMPVLGYCICLTYLLFKVFKLDAKQTFGLSQNFKSSLMPLGIIGLFLVFYSYKTITRNTVWKNSYTLYKADVEKGSSCAKLNYHYGLELVKFGLETNRPQQEQQDWLNKAASQFQKAIEIYPNYPDAYAQMGLHYYRKKQKDKAMEAYKKAIELKPNSSKVFSNMGIIYFEAGNLDKAQEVYEQAVKIDPRFTDALRNLGSVYAMKKQFAKAINYFETALKYAPDDATLKQYIKSAKNDLRQQKLNQQNSSDQK